MIRVKIEMGLKQAMKSKTKPRGQAMLEYVGLFVCIIAAILAIQVYVTRALQGRFRTFADELGEQYAPPGSNIVSSQTQRTAHMTNLVKFEKETPGDPHTDYLIKQIDITYDDRTDVTADSTVPLSD